VDIKSLSNQSQEELFAQVQELRVKLEDVKFGIATGTVKDSSSAKKIKKDIARILTVANQKGA
jgi:ribosomal protein L29